MSTSSTASDTSKKPLVIVLAVIGVLAIIAGILYFAGASPAFLNIGSHVKHGNHLYRGAVAVVVGLVALGYAWFKSKKPASN